MANLKAFSDFSRADSVVGSASFQIIMLSCVNYQPIGVLTLINQQKRRTLKTLTAGSVGVAAATFGPAALSSVLSDNSSEQGTCNVLIKHQWATGQKRLIIENPTRDDVVIDSVMPNSMQSDNGDFIVEIAAPQGRFTVPAGSSLELDVVAKTTDKRDSLRTNWVVELITDKMQIQSSSPALAGVKPVTVFDPYLA